MRIGLVVDGDSEYASLRLLFPALGAATTHTFLKPVVAKFHPESPYGAIARTCLPSVRLLEAKGADRLLILLDRERRAECAGEISAALTQALAQKCGCEVFVIVKDRMFENWLVADLKAIRAQPGRFRISRGVQRAIEPDKADHVDADQVIRRMVYRGSYDKVDDSKRILTQADVDRMAANSRSFRRFLRCAGHPRYEDQSVTP